MSLDEDLPGRPAPGALEGGTMSATMTRRVLRRAKLGGRHAHRSVGRHPVVVAVAAALAAITIGAGVAATQDGPRLDQPRPPHVQLHGPMAGGPPDHRH
jgi:hypothetical protein